MKNEPMKKESREKTNEMQSLFVIRRMGKQTNKRKAANINERNMCAHSLEQANASTSGDYNFRTFHFMLRLITLKEQEKKVYISSK